MQARLIASRPGSKKEFLRELLKQVKIDGSPVTVTSNSGGIKEAVLYSVQFGGGGGNRTPVRESSISATTCLADVLMSLFKPPTAGSLRAIRFRSRPHPLRQRNRPIPLNDVLSDPVGENR